MRLSSQSKPYVPSEPTKDNEGAQEETKEEVKPQNEGEEEQEESKEQPPSSNPYVNAFYNFEYVEPDEEEIKHSQQIADQYLEQQSKEEQEWFIKQEQELLMQLIKDCQVEEFLADGELDEETIKAIYEAAGMDMEGQTPGSPDLEDQKQEEDKGHTGPTIIKRAKGKNKRNNRKKNNKNKQQDVQNQTQKQTEEYESQQNDMFYDNGMYETCKSLNLKFIGDDEVKPFVEDPSLQLMIQYQIQADQEAKWLANDYQFDQQEFPSLVNQNDLKSINRK